MPKWFANSKNARHAKANRKTKKYKEANNSIMNRISARFSKVGNMNMNCAGVAPFNSEMLLSEPLNNYEDEAVKAFCEMDSSNMNVLIDTSEMNDYTDKVATYDNVKEQIVNKLETDYGSLENVYPSVVQALFTGDNLIRQSHKQMFWRVFGDIAIDRLENNLVACRICPKCGIHVPIWSKHSCGDAPIKMIVCPDCGKTVIRTSGKQKRCDECQKEYRKNYARSYMQKLRTGSISL